MQEKVLTGYLEKQLPEFFKKVGVNWEENKELLNLHLEECSKYRSKWVDNGIPYEHGIAVYLLTYIKPFSEEVKLTDHGWVAPDDWVIKNYFSRFKNKLLPVGLFKVCYVCGKVRTTHRYIGKGLYRCSSKECELKTIVGIDRLYIDSYLIPLEGITKEWKKTITKKEIPFIGVDCSSSKGKIVIKDPFLPIPDKYTYQEKLKKHGKIPQSGGIEEMIHMMRHGKYTLEELAKENKLALSTVKTQVLYRLKEKFQIEKEQIEGKTYYTIID